MIHSQYADRGILIYVNGIDKIIIHDCEFKDCFYRELFPKTHYGLFRDSNGEYGLIRDKFIPGNFVVADYLKFASINFERDRLAGGYNVKSDDVKNNSVINSFSL
jgi:hypothetical protein